MKKTMSLGEFEAFYVSHRGKFRITHKDPVLHIVSIQDVLLEGIYSSAQLGKVCLFKPGKKNVRCINFVRCISYDYSNGGICIVSGTNRFGEGEIITTHIVPM